MFNGNLEKMMQAMMVEIQTMKAQQSVYIQKENSTAEIINGLSQKLQRIDNDLKSTIDYLKKAEEINNELKTENINLHSEKETLQIQNTKLKEKLDLVRRGLNYAAANSSACWQVAYDTDRKLRMISAKTGYKLTHAELLSLNKRVADQRIIELREIQELEERQKAQVNTRLNQEEESVNEFYHSNEF
jgi:hypothetical protein